ncbi:ARM repeat superfamily protein [Prunus dulcis]|uniref:ARM repeat superfamily protein n=1 Tax=Prunus dulcis TaxID=3755 RepID=A0A4Y1R1R1_PRUDU|nr:ARM repeat superfamily protein [Prunus dulcis]
MPLSEPISESLSKAQCTQPEGTNVSLKALLEPLLPHKQPPPSPNFNDTQLHSSIRDFTFACALLSSSQSFIHDLLSWIPKHLSAAADLAFLKLSKAYSMAYKLMPEVLPLLKNRIKESSIDKSEDCDEVSAASARVPVGFAIAAAYQFRWFVTQIDYPHLGKLSALVIPCALTALDHWSPEIKGQGMLSFIHIAKNVYAAELGWYQDVILDACCQNIASSDEIWHLVVEMSVLIVTCTQQSNPRSAWFDRMLKEMLSHLERQPRNKERRVAWLRHIEPLFNGVGLVLLAHFRRIFPLFFQWMHADDDETVLLVLKQIETIIKLTWIRNTQYVERLVDETCCFVQGSSIEKVSCKGMQFETVWDKHRDDPNLASIVPSLGETKTTMVAQ